MRCLLIRAWVINWSLGFDRDWRGVDDFFCTRWEKLLGAWSWQGSLEPWWSSQSDLAVKSIKANCLQLLIGILLDKQDFAIRDYRIRGCYKMILRFSPDNPKWGNHFTRTLWSYHVKPLKRILWYIAMIEVTFQNSDISYRVFFFFEVIKQ